MSKLKKVLGTRVRQLRNQLGLTQEALSEKADLDWRSIGSVERGERNLSLDSLERVSQALGVTPAYLLETPENKKELSEKDLLFQEIVYLLNDKNNKDLKFTLDLIKRIFEYTAY
ncbi:helix-turn-helix domain-containing protein [bacterium]|nr:helix-turn-helix domain-containing protein [bacterium]MBU1614312.1 helix-turn-helix domain-containing protein [bacterium]